MFGFNYIKAQPTQYVVAYKNGKIIKQGAGLSMLCYTPTTTIALIPLTSKDDDFIFGLNCADFQKITVQGQVSYRISEPEKISNLLNFALRSDNRGYASDDPEKLKSKVLQLVESLTKNTIQKLYLRDALVISGELSIEISKQLSSHPEIAALGLTIVSVSILAVKPEPETAKALEAEARESILKVADDAIFLRRNAAVENERAIRENELDTEIAVEQKRRNIRETQIEAEASIQIKQQQIDQTQLQAEIELEKQRQEFIICNASNIRTMAEAEAYRVAAIVEALRIADPKVIQVLAASGMQPAQLIAQAFTGLADKAEKIGQLNLSPDLLQTIMNHSNNNIEK